MRTRNQFVKLNLFHLLYENFEDLFLVRILFDDFLFWNLVHKIMGNSRTRASCELKNQRIKGILKIIFGSNRY
jgi:hypothetical protein